MKRFLNIASRASAHGWTEEVAARVEDPYLNIAPRPIDDPEPPEIQEPPPPVEEEIEDNDVREPPPRSPTKR